MRLPGRRRQHHDRAETRRARQLQRALDVESSNEVLEAAYDRADQDNARMRFAIQSRQGSWLVGLFGVFGLSRRPSLRQQLKEEGYDGD